MRVTQPTSGPPLHVCMSTSDTRFPLQTVLSTSETPLHVNHSTTVERIMQFQPQAMSDKPARCAYGMKPITTWINQRLRNIKQLVAPASNRPARCAYVTYIRCWTYYVRAHSASLLYEKYSTTHRQHIRVTQIHARYISQRNVRLESASAKSARL